MLFRLPCIACLIIYLCFPQITFSEEIEKVNILVLGDSYSVGTGIDPIQAWPQQLARELEHNTIQHDITVIAQNGWTTDKLLAALQSAQLKTQYDFILVLIGVNDIVRWRADTDYHNRLLTLLDEAVEYADSKRFSQLIIFSLPDYGVTPVGQRFGGSSVSDSIDGYNRQIDLVCKMKGCSVVKITDISRQASKDLTLLAEDQLHPSAKMYRQWVERLLSLHAVHGFYAQ